MVIISVEMAGENANESVSMNRHRYCCVEIVQLLAGDAITYAPKIIIIRMKKIGWEKKNKTLINLKLLLGRRMDAVSLDSQRLFAFPFADI